MKESGRDGRRKKEGGLLDCFMKKGRYGRRVREREEGRREKEEEREKEREKEEGRGDDLVEQKI